MFIDVSPLKNNEEFRKLFLGQTISFLGSMMTYVAIPYQAYAIKQDSFYVGLISSIQLIPLVLAGLYGGALADSADRRKLLLYSEWGLLLISLLFVINSLLANPSYILLCLLAAFSSALVGIHRPAMDALIPQIVDKKDLISVSALGSLRYAIGAVTGPALGGILISMYGAVATYLIDAFSFLISIYFIYRMKSLAKPSVTNKANLNSIIEGIQYAVKNPVLLGTYLVDIIAMVFAMPMALYPEIVHSINKKDLLGWLYAAIPLGAGFTSLFSGKFQLIRRHGAAVILAATSWGFFIIGMGLTSNIYFMIICLFLAGAADNISAIYRSTIWNESIPTEIRGRLGSLNMLSYMIGPLIGNLRAGTISSLTSPQFSILSGGILCAIFCFASIWIFPTFWKYKEP